MDRLLAEFKIPPEKQREILDWYNQHQWSSEYILHSHNPLSGVLEVIRWFQLQPNGITTEEDQVKIVNTMSILCIRGAGKSREGSYMFNTFIAQSKHSLHNVNNPKTLDVTGKTG